MEASNGGVRWRRSAGSALGESCSLTVVHFPEPSHRYWPPLVGPVHTVVMRGDMLKVPAFPCDAVTACGS